ncbi:NAD(P)-dependent dehydrogenase (short-subunit alcohol dehydrogenase family) [Kineothrix alysoides]|uniref:NAD(P)-dependent dehydrogenase (Short-subunit alcohol dehydrogenase family) n=1 Tax=Kineothrix alysoides TaxID=1469948 RepID=A0A4R1QXL5_9FIRM|nr:SDR family NAD(P)-dependent oxidoreductase [Kineothrix alysoides]TCL56674.1 NAD(P)-dependent dehydrogenase (short-subunit alcohol dehydrogenase family) [Kineothrix alysoides]
MNNKKTIIITGANSGLGLASAKMIASASMEYQVILACRNKAKAERAKQEVIENSGNSDIHILELDVSSLASVRDFVKKYKEQQFPSLYALICNAGISGRNMEITADGYDSVFATNHLGHFLLVHLLLPSMQPAGRIVMVSSDMHCPPGRQLVWPGTLALAHPDNKLEKNHMRRYSFSKLCNLYFTYELSRRLINNNSKIVVNAFNPGLMMETNFMPKYPGFLTFVAKKIFADRAGSLEVSAKGLAELVTEQIYGEKTGKYYDRGTVERKSSPLSYNLENTMDLWNKSVEFTKITSST